MGCDCPTEPEGVADTDGPFREPFTLAQEPDTIAMFSRANKRSSWFSTVWTIVVATKEGGVKASWGSEKIPLLREHALNP